MLIELFTDASKNEAFDFIVEMRQLHSRLDGYIEAILRLYGVVKVLLDVRNVKNNAALEHPALLSLKDMNKDAKDASI